MEPLSLTKGILALLSAVATTSKGVTDFIRGCREARSDLTAVSRELSELAIVLELLKDDSDVADDSVIPEAIQKQILSILLNCKDVIAKVDDVLAQHAGKLGAARWVMVGKKDAANLRQSLEAHRGALGLALETVTLSLEKDIKQDTKALRVDTTDIKEDTSQILAEIERLKRLVSADGNDSSQFLLNRYLDNMTTYAETVYDETIRDYTPEHSDAEAEPPEANQHEPDVVSDVEPDLARQDQQMYDDASQIGLRSAMKHNLGERSDHGRSVAVLPTSISITGPRQAVDTASTLKEGIGAFMKQMKEDKIWQHHPRLTTLRPQSVSSGAHGFSSSRESYQQQHPIATVSRQRSGSEPASEDDDNGGDYDVDEYGRKVNKNKTAS